MTVFAVNHAPSDWFYAIRRGLNKCIPLNMEALRQYFHYSLTDFPQKGFVVYVGVLLVKCGEPMSRQWTNITEIVMDPA